MCEILCISSRAAVQANDLLREFYADSLYHPHGWGLAWYEEGEFALCKEPLRAMDSLELSSLLSVPILTTQMMAHIRNATRGVMSY